MYTSQGGRSGGGRVFGSGGGSGTRCGVPAVQEHRTTSGGGSCVHTRIEESFLPRTTPFSAQFRPCPSDSAPPTQFIQTTPSPALRALLPSARPSRTVWAAVVDAPASFRATLRPAGAAFAVVVIVVLPSSSSSS